MMNPPKFSSKEEAHNYLRSIGKPEYSIHHTAIIYDEYCEIADHVNIGPYSVIGYIGFGCEPSMDGVEMVNHIGKVIIENDVYIKALSTIDRSKLPQFPTIIREGTKIDNLVHVGHNAVIGKWCEIVAGSVIGGSTDIGDNVFIGEKASIRDHVKIGKNSVIGQGSNVVQDIPENSVVVGNPGKVVRQVRSDESVLPLRSTI